jgi:hypothetical protein
VSYSKIRLPMRILCGKSSGVSVTSAGGVLQLEGNMATMIVIPAHGIGI